MCLSCGIELVTTTASKQALLILEMAGPEKMPCVSMAYTLVAPASKSLNWSTRCVKVALLGERIVGIYLSAAWQMVPQVSAMSSTKMATRSLTSPTRTMAATSLAFFRSLWISAKSTLRRSAIDVTLQGNKQVRMRLCWNLKRQRTFWRLRHLARQWYSFAIQVCFLWSTSRRPVRRTDCRQVCRRSLEFETHVNPL